MGKEGEFPPRPEPKESRRKQKKRRKTEGREGVGAWRRGGEGGLPLSLCLCASTHCSLSWLTVHPQVTPTNAGCEWASMSMPPFSIIFLIPLYIYAILCRRVLTWPIIFPFLSTLSVANRNVDNGHIAFFFLFFFFLQRVFRYLLLLFSTVSASLYLSSLL